LLDLQAEYEYWVSQKLAAASGTQRTARRKWAIVSTTAFVHQYNVYDNLKKVVRHHE
jgi:hypothetical protein